MLFGPSFLISAVLLLLLALLITSPVTSFTWIGEGNDIDWTIDYAVSGEILTFTLTAPTLGWLSVGFTEGGGIIGVYMEIAWVDANGNAQVEDRFAVAHSTPPLDEACASNGVANSQQWTAISGSEDNVAGTTTVTLSRPIVSLHKQDWNIVDNGDASRIVLAWSINDSDSFSFHGPNYYVFRLNLFQEKSVEELLLETLALDPDVKTSTFTMVSS